MNKEDTLLFLGNMYELSEDRRTLNLARNSFSASNVGLLSRLVMEGPEILTKAGHPDLAGIISQVAFLERCDLISYNLQEIVPYS